MPTDAWGIDDGWQTSDGRWQPANPDTIETFRSLIGEPLPTPTADAGTRRQVRHYPERAWGVTAQVFSLRSPWGVGGVTQIGEVGRWIAGLGGSVVGLSPLGDPLPVTPRPPSPYSPSSRETLDPLVIDPSRWGATPPPGVGRHDEPGSIIDRDAAWAAIRAELELRWQVERASRRASGTTAPDAGPLAARHATFTALAEHHGGGWRTWPVELHDPRSPTVAAWIEAHRALVDFWGWVDATADAQLSDCSSALRSLGVSLMGDLPVGVHPSGADAWYDQELLAPGVTVGAPPDTFNPAGQDWALPAYLPHALRESGFEPVRRMIAAALRWYGGLRVDHVMGWFRLFWIPDGAGPEDGTYVRYPARELIDAVVHEVDDAGAFLVGEDLGTVEPEVRREMAARGIASTKVALFESRTRRRWPERSLGALTTHDLPTVRGLLEHRDPRWDPRLARSLRRFAGRPRRDPRRVAEAAHGRLGRSRSGLVLATLEDLAWSADRVNLPGTIDEYPNWRVPMPVDIATLAEDPFARRCADALRRSRSDR
ncbi:MAG TPA: 4-alpha-glucanotransferase [Microthrixaceae bacterium]|nr:4-alpha-glucanotransferase [Microthrixaceae bacterium]